MKLRRCDWVPLSVANWLCEELDERGIPGTTYSHTLLSLLHPYFCPHPVPKDPNQSSKCLVWSESLRSYLEAGQAKEFEILFDELEEHVHPDADFPELIISDNIKSGSKKAKKRLKKLQELSYTPEKLWKEAAHQCLSTASEDRVVLKVVVDELFKKLKSLNKTPGEDINYNFSDFEPKNNSIDKTCDFSTLHSSNFPPLSTPPPPIETSVKSELVIDWKTVIKNKFSPRKETLKPNPILNQIDKIPRDVKRSLELEFCMADKNRIASTMEIGSNEFNANPQLDLKSSHFIPIISSNPPSFYSNDDVLDTSQEAQLKSVREQLEGWECASILPVQETREVSVDLLGNRLFERSAVDSANTTRCNSISDLEEDKIKVMEKNICHSSAHDWGVNAAESWQDKRTDLVWGVSMTSPHEIEEIRPHLVNSWVIPDESNWNSQSGNLNSLPLSNSWSVASTTDWSSQALSNSTNDPFLSSAIEETSFPDKRKDDDPSVFNLGRGNLKDIWSSDCNDNNVPVSSGIIEGEHTNCSIDDSNGINDFQRDDSEERLCKTFQSLGLEHLWQDSIPSTWDSAKQQEDDFQSDYLYSVEGREQLFSAEELYSMKMKYEKEIDPNSFTSDIPSGPNGPFVELKHTESSGFSTVVPHKMTELEGLQDELMLMNERGEQIWNSDQVEENLLTSPRTHFRPIRQDSNISTQEDSKSDESHAILNAAGGLQDSYLIFQRTDSGTLFLESDIVEGSPKKYMIYREPSVKPSADAAKELSFLPHQQQLNAQSFIPKFKIINNEKFCQTEENSSINLGQNIDKELSLKFFNSLNTKNSSPSVDSIWKSERANNLKMLWDEKNADLSPSPRKEAWEMPIADSSLSLPKWSTNELKSANWSKQNLSNYSLNSFDKSTSNLLFVEQKKKNEMSSENDDSFSKIKFIWHNSIHNEDKNANGFSEKKMDSCSFSLNGETNNVSDLDHSSLSGVANLWNTELRLDSNLPSDSLKCTKSTDPLSNLQWEVEQEADEILGALLPSPLCDDLIQVSMTASTEEKEDLNFSNFFENQEVNHPVEDLDNLEPGWDFNEGFEWGPASENDDSDEREVFIYENEEGKTVMVPIEYLDNNLYDEIFGSESNIPVGGSLPDLPQGHMAEWKKLSRRSKGTRFVPPSRRPCSFYLEGNCLRSDCKFSHDLTAITCRFWEEGSCLKGDTCQFRHGAAPTRRRNRSEGDQTSLLDSFNFSLKEGSASAAGLSKNRNIPRKNRVSSTSSMSSFEIDSEADFPCLGSSLDSKPGSLEDTTLEAVIKATKKKKKFIAVTKTTLKDYDIERKFCEGSKISRSERRKASNKNVRIATLSDSFNKELCKKKKKSSAKDKEKSECESLRKILRKRHATAPQASPNWHEDGTLSDF